MIEQGAAAQLLVRDRDRHGLSGLAVRVVTPDGGVTPVGTTDADGLVDYLPGQVGRHAARVTTADGVEVVVSFDVVARPMRELWFVVGLLLAALFLRGPWLRWREARRSEPAAG